MKEKAKEIKEVSSEALKAERYLSLIELKERKREGKSEAEQFFCFKLGVILSESADYIALRDLIYGLQDENDEETVWNGVYYALEAIKNGDFSSEEEQRERWLDEIEADCYTSDLTAWLHASVLNVAWLDEAISEYGGAAIKDGSTLSLLMTAQQLAKRGIASATLNAVNRRRFV